MHAAPVRVDEGQRELTDRAPDGVRGRDPEQAGRPVPELDHPAVRGPHEHPGAGEVTERLELRGQRPDPHPVGRHVARRAGRRSAGAGEGHRERDHGRQGDQQGDQQGDDAEGDRQRDSRAPVGAPGDRTRDGQRPAHRPASSSSAPSW